MWKVNYWERVSFNNLKVCNESWWNIFSRLSLTNSSFNQIEFKKYKHEFHLKIYMETTFQIQMFVLLSTKILSKDINY